MQWLGREKCHRRNRVLGLRDFPREWMPWEEPPKASGCAIALLALPTVLGGRTPTERARSTSCTLPTRQQQLVPLRYGRMLQSPFTFYRGSAAVMANDMAYTPNTGIYVQACGDCHLMNFGGSDDCQ